MDESGNKTPIYVVDTNVIIDYVDIIPCCDGHIEELDEPTIDLKNSHIVIPTAVIRELSSFKKESSERGKAARTALKRIRFLMKNREEYSIKAAYNLTQPVKIEETNQLFSVLPVHKNFSNCLPFNPSTKDMDGQIILATLSVIFIQSGLSVAGDVKRNELDLPYSEDITLLTNDNGLAARANTRGIHTERFGYRRKPPYTGRRDLEVPANIFAEFINGGELDRYLWENAMPNQAPLVANEFLIMHPANNEYPNGWGDYEENNYCYIGRYDVREDKIVPLKHIKQFPTAIKNAGQAIFAEALQDEDIDMVIVSGPAGSGKTYMATIHGYLACKNGQYINVITVPCDTPENNNLGALPGDLDQKLDPDVAPIKEALSNYLIETDKGIRKKLNHIDKFGAAKSKVEEDESPGVSLKNKLKELVDLIWGNWFENIYIGAARGRSFYRKYVILDEFQDHSISQADTLIKRLGFRSKMVITGDTSQIHNTYNDAYNNGLTYAINEVKDDYQVAVIELMEEDVERHRLVRLIAERQKKRRNKT